MNLPRYVQQRYTPKGVRTYRFNPPRQLVDNGVVSRKELGDSFNEAMVDYHKKVCKRISMFEDKYNALAVAGLAALVKIPVTPIQKQSG